MNFANRDSLIGYQWRNGITHSLRQSRRVDEANEDSRTNLSWRRESRSHGWMPHKIGCGSFFSFFFTAVYATTASNILWCLMEVLRKYNDIRFSSLVLTFQSSRWCGINPKYEFLFDVRSETLRVEFYVVLSLLKKSEDEDMRNDCNFAIIFLHMLTEIIFVMQGNWQTTNVNDILQLKP